MTPNWRALVAEAGADPECARVGAETFSRALCEIRTGDGSYIAIVQPSGTATWRALINGNRSRSLIQTNDPREAITAALSSLRAELRARMERDAAALRRLGGVE